MSNENIELVLKKYGWLDGALVLGIHFQTGLELSQRTAAVELKAFIVGADSKSGWRKIEISTMGKSIFGWCEIPWETNLVLNYSVKLLRHGTYDIIDFDPLHAKISKEGALLSSYFIGGAELSIDESNP